MMQGVFGLPGAGKTTFLTKYAQKCLQGKSFLRTPPHSRVFTNFECSGCYRFDFDDLGKYDFSDSLILIDEIMLYADTRNFKTFPEELKRFFALHRHFRTDVCYCSQYFDDMDKKLRVLTDRLYLLERGVLLSQFSFVKPIHRVLGVVDGRIQDAYLVGAPVTWSFVYRPHYYEKFDSFAHDELPRHVFEKW